MVISNSDTILSIINSLAHNSSEIRVDPVNGIPFMAHVLNSSFDGVIVQIDHKHLSQLMAARSVKIILDIAGHKLQFESKHISHKGPKDGSIIECHLVFPSEIQRKDVREFVRIELSSRNQLKATLNIEDTVTPVTVLDVSPSGVKITSRRLELSAFDPGAAGIFSVQSISSEEIINLKFVIMWKHGQVAGLLLPEKKDIDLRNSDDTWLALLRKIIEVDILTSKNS